MSLDEMGKEIAQMKSDLLDLETWLREEFPKLKSGRAN